MGSSPSTSANPVRPQNQPQDNSDLYNRDYDADYDTVEDPQTAQSRKTSFAGNPAQNQGQPNPQNNLQVPNNQNVSPTQARRAQELQQMQQRQGVIQEEDEGEGDDGYDNAPNNMNNMRPVNNGMQQQYQDYNRQPTMNQYGNQNNMNMNQSLNRGMSQNNMGQEYSQGGGRFSEYADDGYSQVNMSRGPNGGKTRAKKKKKKKKGKKKKVKPSNYYVEGGGGTIEMPKYSRFVTGIKSPIPYPVYLEDVQKKPGYLFFNFTQNTNVFDVLEEEKLFLTPVTEITKIFEVFNQAKQGRWTDKEFPARIESFSRSVERQALYRNLVWKRYTDIIPRDSPITLFDDLNYNEIVPGRLADFAFQSMVVILSGQPGVLPANFPDINDRSQTVFAVWLNDGGQWKPVIVDDYFPFDPVAKRWAFCSTEPNVDLWVLVLEKAFAKLYGTYDSLLRGHPAHYIHDLTGSPYDHYYFDEEQNFWDFLTMLNSETSIVVAMNKDPEYLIETESCLEKKPSYSYEIVNQAQVQLGHKVQKLIQLSNVLDPNDWDGDWSVNSDLWTPELMEQLNPEGYPDDAFWISIEDFLQFYGVGFMFTVFEDHLYSSIKLRHPKNRNYSLVLMHVPGEEGGHGFFKISQRDIRHYDKDKNMLKYEYSTVRMMYGKVDANLKLEKFFGGIHDKGRDCEIEIDLDPGDYLVYLEVDWQNNYAREFVLNTYHQTNVVFYEIETKEEKVSLVSRFIKSYFFSCPEAKPSQNYLGLDGDRLHRTIEYIYGYLAFYYMNISDCVSLEETVKMEVISGLQICAPHVDSKKFTVKVPPQNDALVLYNTTRGYPLKYHYRPTSLSVIYPDGDPEIIRDVVIDNATRVFKRKFTKHGEIDVTIYVYEFEGGVCMYYQNETAYIYREQIRFTLSNLEALDGSNKNNFDIELDPTEGYILRFKVKDATKQYSYSTKVRFKLRGYSGGQMLPGQPATVDDDLDDVYDPGNLNINQGGQGTGGTEMYLPSNRLQFQESPPATQANVGNGGVIQKYLNQQALLKLAGKDQPEAVNSQQMAGLNQIGGLDNSQPGGMMNNSQNMINNSQNMMNNSQNMMSNSQQTGALNNSQGGMNNNQSSQYNNAYSAGQGQGNISNQQGQYNANQQAQAQSQSYNNQNIQGYQQQDAQGNYLQNQGHYDPQQGFYDPNDPQYAQGNYDPNDPQAQGFYDPQNPQNYYNDPHAYQGQNQGHYDPQAAYQDPQSGQYQYQDPQGGQSQQYNQGFYDPQSQGQGHYDPQGGYGQQGNYAQQQGGQGYGQNQMTGSRK